LRFGGEVFSEDITSSEGLLMSLNPVQVLRLGNGMHWSGRDVWRIKARSVRDM